MSRHPIYENRKRYDRATKIVEEYVNFIVENDIPKAMLLSEIVDATYRDPLSIQDGKWFDFVKAKSPERTALCKLKNKFTLSENGIIIRDNIILIPQELRKRFVKLAHEGHQGIVKAKSLLREKVWFPGIDRLVENEIQNCIACQATVECKNTEPLKMTAVNRMSDKALIS